MMHIDNASNKKTYVYFQHISRFYREQHSLAFLTTVFFQLFGCVCKTKTRMVQLSNITHQEGDHLGHFIAKSEWNSTLKVPWLR